jgi:hypothetical protein
MRKLSTMQLDAGRCTQKELKSGYKRAMLKCRSPPALQHRRPALQPQQMRRSADLQPPRPATRAAVRRRRVGAVSL